MAKHYYISLLLCMLCACNVDPRWEPRVLTIADSITTTYKSADIQLTLPPDCKTVIKNILVEYSSTANMDTAHKVTMSVDESGVWRTQLLGLADSCIYYYRYKIEPELIYYTRDKYSFMTATLPPPFATTIQATDIKFTSARLHGSASRNLDAAIVERGFYYNLLREDTIFRKQIICGAGEGEFEAVAESLRANATYFFVAYARNAHGIAYGDTLQINTLNPYE